jgi:hypothetical protein
MISVRYIGLSLGVSNKMACMLILEQNNFALEEQLGSLSMQRVMWDGGEEIKERYIN